MSSSLKNLTINDTGSVTLPVGSTAQRPTAAAGMTRFNNSLGAEEYYNGSAWVSKKPMTYNADFIVVGGGGGGGGNGPGPGTGGGGGGGGVVLGNIPIVVGTVYAASIGTGGSGGSSAGSVAGTAGSSTTLTNNSSGQTFTAYGGGPGGNAGNTSNPATLNGGSGGGGTTGIPLAGSTTQTYQNGVLCYGSPGTAGTYPSAGGATSSGSANTGVGGNGYPTNITGSITYYGGGGGTWAGTSVVTANGGLGGGGGLGTGPTDAAGTPNTGGGGGNSYSSSPGGTGGSGVVIVLIPNPFWSGTTTGSPTVTYTTSGAVVKFNAPGTFTG